MVIEEQRVIDRHAEKLEVDVHDNVCEAVIVRNVVAEKVVGDADPVDDARIDTGVDGDALSEGCDGVNTLDLLNVPVVACETDGNGERLIEGRGDIEGLPLLLDMGLGER